MIHGDETVYGTDYETDSGLSSERVQGLATGIYKEFERMISQYDENVVKELMPLVVTILENLDQSMTNCSEYAVEIELLKDDKEQLKTQFERERQLRRLAEQRQMESEDAVELATRELRQRAESLEGTTRQLEMRCKNHIDQVDRLQEREAELKTEYNELHQRHTEMIQSYVEHIEKTKALQQTSAPEITSSPKPNYGSWYRKEVTKVLDSTSPVTPGSPQSVSMPLAKLPTPQTPNAHTRGLMLTPDFDRSHTSIKDEMPNTPMAGQQMQDNADRQGNATSAIQKTQSAKEETKHTVNTDATIVDSKSNPELLAPSDEQKMSQSTHQLNVTGSKKGNLSHAAVEKPTELKATNPVLDHKSKLQEASVSTTDRALSSAISIMPVKESNIGDAADLVEKPEGVSSVPADDAMEAGDWVASEVKEMLKLGPDITPDNMKEPIADTFESRQAGIEGTSENTGIENEAFEHDVQVNKDSLFAEMSRNDLQDVDCGADILGVGKEVENLIHENTKLLATKNALNVVKDDLIHQVDQLTTQLSMLQEELEKAQQAKDTLQGRVAGLEADLSKLRKQMSEMESSTTNHVSKTSEEDESVPMSQRKRFTRVEMARVLMERNQYKERLMELQEAVRWTEMLRASRDHPDLNPQKNKNKSSIFQFFSRLFTSSGNSGNAASTSPSSTSPSNSRRRSGVPSVDMNIGYNVPTSKVMPKSRSGTVSMYGRSPTIEAMQDSGAMLKNEAKRGNHEPGDASRMQACGWSLPGITVPQIEKSRTVPVPVYCIPLINANANAKLWCAAAVNIAIGKTRDGGSIVGTGSVFYARSPDDTSRKTANSSRSNIDRLDQEIESQKRDMEKEASKREALSSLVWLVSSDFRAGQGLSGGTKVRVIDARDPSKSLETFSVGSTDANILCITSVPGIQEEDYMNIDESNLTAANDSSNVGSGGLAQSSSMPEEVATEATEETENISTNNTASTVTEHVFTDPLGIRAKSSSTVKIPQNAPGDSQLNRLTPLQNEPNDTVIGSPAYGALQVVRSPVTEDQTMSIDDDASEQLATSEVEMGFTRVDPDITDGRLTSLQPTMWLGSQNGCVFVHSAVSNWSRCVHQIRLKDSVLAIVHISGRALAALADGTIAIFRRNNGVWDLSNYHLLDLGRPLHSIRCMTVVYDKVWCGYRNKIRIIDPKSMQIETSFNAHPRRESQVRGLAWAGDGVWVSIRLDSTLRLYHARTLQHLQDVDVEPYVSKVLGTGKLGFSFVRITALIASSSRLWIGTGNGVVISVPLSENAKSVVGAQVSASTSSTSIARSDHGPGGVVRVYSDPVSEKVTPGTYIPYCSMANAQLSFHGHRDAVKFFVSVPGCVTQAKGNLDAEEKNPCPSAFAIAEHGANASSLVMSGGEGYIDFRLCDGGVSPQQESALQARSTPDISTVGVRTQNRSHLIVWQLTPSK